jgi:hypothetical protein
MPTFETIPLQEAKKLLSLTGKRGAIMKEYLGYIERLEPGKAGKLTLGEGETSAAIKGRLSGAAKVSGDTLEVKRIGDDIYFWREDAKRGRGRPRKTQ